MRNENIHLSKNRAGEEGAALVMALLVSALLLVASAGLLLETTANTQNVMDSTSEQQALSAAESGIQAAVDVLRDNVTLPTGRLLETDRNLAQCQSSVTPIEQCRRNRIDYIKALTPADSNLDPDDPLDVNARLSRWLNYNQNAPDRVALGDGTYVAQNGYAFSLDISDPDHTGVFVTYRARGKLGDHDLNTPAQKTYSGATVNDRIIVRHLEQSPVRVDTTDGGTRSFGTFQLEKQGNGACILNNNRLQIEVTMTEPYYGLRIIRGYVMANATACNLTDYPTPNVRFDSVTFTLQGSLIRLLSTGGNAVDDVNYRVGPPPGFDSQLVAAASGATTNSELRGDMGSPEPRRLYIKSTGYGPRGATKQLHAVIQKNFFNSLTAPATLTLIGPASTTATAACTTCNPATPAQPATNFQFEFGTSNTMEYSGLDAASTDIIPPIGAWGDGNVGTIFDVIDGHSNGTDRWNTVTGVPSDISSDTPPWLSTPSNLDEYVQMQYADAFPRGRYFASGVQPDADTTDPYPFGNYQNGTGITICDGDCTFTGEGGGILIVTGKLTLHGNFSFKGIILITGQGGVDRRGGGTGDIQGNMIIAPYVNSSILPESEPLASNFLAPQYDLSGGGNSEIRYNSNALTSALQSVDNFVLGVVEK